MSEELTGGVASAKAATYVPLERRRRHIRGVLLLSDALALTAAVFLATYVRFGRLDAAVSFANAPIVFDYVQMSLIVTLLWLSFLGLEHLYDLDRLLWGSGEFSRIVRALSMGVVGFILLTYALHMPGLSRAWVLLAWLFSCGAVIAGRLVIRLGIQEARKRGRMRARALVVGSNAEAADIIRILRGSPSSGIEPIGCLASSRQDQLNLDYCSDMLPVLGYARELLDVLERHRVDTVIIASSAFDHDVLARMIAEMRGRALDMHVSSGLFEVLTSRVIVREVSGVPLITVKGVSFTRRKLIQKRSFDLLVSSAIILLGLPLWLLVALGIKLDSKGPIFYRQPRVGRGGNAFGMLKFRSMVDDADARLAQLREDNEVSGPMFKIKHDPRVTRMGRWMRKYSIDEFPQLLNVLRGEMSLVGPRPPLLEETVRYTEHDWRRMEVLPGMTGLWQVSGRSNLSFTEMVRLDLFYIENWSVGLDMALILRTLPAVLLGQGAY